MKVSVTIPQLGESVVEGTILEWHKKEGDFVKKDEVLLVLSTDKVNAEVPAPATGKLSRILFAEGETVPVGAEVASIETEVEEGRGDTETGERGETETRGRGEIERQEEIEVQRQEDRKVEMTSPRPRISPLARAIAEKEGIPLEEIEQKQGSGPSGRIMKQDILADLKTKRRIQETKPEPIPSPSQVLEEEVQKPEGKEREIGFRQPGISAIPRLRVLGPQLVPHATALIEVDMTRIVRHLEKTQGEKIIRSSEWVFLPFVLVATVKALKQFPTLNGLIEDGTIALKESVHIGFTVPLEDRVVVPLIKEAQGLNLLGMSKAIEDLIYRAQTRKLEPEELQGGTFTVSNAGAFGVVVDAPLIQPPQIGILGIGAVKKRPVVVEDMIGIRWMMYASLSYDYRAVDGSTAAQFLQAFARNLETMELDY
ncbi:MAG TPA: dihydrolipoamide acetyltransferase family protein [Candidatus Limnocylindrales bacterium]|nr:dihydrolipoamide acetyltransferase family protein [Candidatus Limnocylindrales bacterium]